MVEYKSVNELESLSRRFDIFDTGSDDTETHAATLLSRGIHMPLPVCGGFLLHGFPLLSAAGRLGIQTLLTVMIPEKDTAGMLELALLSENRAGSYSFGEKERMMNLLSWPESMDSYIVSLIEGHEHEGFVTIMKEYESMDGALKQLIDDRTVDLKTALAIRSLPTDIFDLFCRQRQELSLSFSRTRMLLTFFHESVERDALGDAEAVSEFRTLLMEKDPVEAARRLRYPQLTSLEDRFEKIRNMTVEGTGIRLDPPPFFEGGRYTLSFSFGSGKELERKVNQSSRIGEKVNELFDLL